MGEGAAPLSLSLQADGDQPSLVVSGQVDHSNVYRLITVLDYLVDEHERCVLLDLADVHSIDTAALTCLAESAGQLTEKQRRLRVTDASGAVRKCLKRHVLNDLVCSEEHCTGCCEIAPKTWQVELFSLPSDVAFCHEARTRIKRIAEAAGLGGNWLRDVLMATGEAVTNAIKHGHSGADDSSFTVSCLASPERICISVSDSGPGFCMDDVPTFEEALFMEHGRGIHCMNSLMDEVSFMFDGGTSIRLVKHAG